VAALLAAVALVSIACTTGGGGGVASGDLAEDQTLRLWLDGEPDYIDPSIADFATAVAVSKNVFATLLRFDPTVGEAVPYVAVQVPSQDNGGISDDGLTYTFTLREDAVWEDGRPITAQDFVYAVKRLLDPRLGSYYGTTYYTEIIEGGADLAAAVDADEATLAELQDAVNVRAVDDRTLEVTITRPSNTFNLLMSLWPTAALRQDVIEQYGDITNTTWTEAGNLVASGPFRLAEWNHGSSIVLERNPNFWAEEMDPILDRVTFQIIEDENTAFSAYLAGDLDAVPVPVADLRRIAADDSYQDELQRVPMATTFVFQFNQSKPPFDQLEARKAFCQSVDRKTLVNEVQQGQGVPTTSWLPNGLVPYFVEERGEDLAFNPSSALDLVLDPSRVANPSVGLSFANIDPNSTRAEFLQGQWKENLGVDVKLDALDPPAFGETYFTGNYDMAFLGFGEDYHHPENWLLPFTSEGVLNTGGYSNPEFDSTVDQALNESDPGEAVKLWQEAERILVDEDVAICPLFAAENTWVVKPYVANFIMTAADGQPGDFFYWKTAILDN
jgi:oligopeptide transport system substrate-binding protein